MGETRVDLVHLLEDLRDAYPGSLEDTILTEIVANSLDSGARTLELSTDPQAATLLAVDDGAGMTRRALTRYHDLASTTKRRGKGIGFAGVGIKLGLLACDEVVTETRGADRRSGNRPVATSWRLSNRTRAPWSWIPAPGYVDGHGTAVLLRLSNPLSQLLDPGFLEVTVLRHYQPLFEPEFLEILSPVYPDGISIVLNGRVVVGPIRPADRLPVALRVGRQRKPSAVGYLARHDSPLPEHERGLAISTRGKVIRRGWDWLGLTPAEPDRVEGLIEVPALAEALTLNKGDFLRHGARGTVFLSYRKAIQEAAAPLLADWGEAPEPRRRSPRTRPIERDLREVLDGMAEEFPVLATLAERRSGGQRRLPLGGPAAPGRGEWSGEEPIDVSGDGAPAAGREEAEPPASAGTPPGGEGEPGMAWPPEGDGASADTGQAAPSREEPEPPGAKAAVHLPGRARRRAPTRLSLSIRFESRSDDDALGRLIESTVWVNDEHPAYRRARASRSEGYHIALTAAAALAPFVVEPERTQHFVNAFLARWGRAPGRNDERG